MTALALASPEAALRDPALASRSRWTIGIALVIVASGWISEFDPRTLWSAAGARAMSQFVASFFPPRLAPDFLVMVGRATWQTVAIATVGTTAAIMLAIPAALVATRQLSISAVVDGRMCVACAVLRRVVRGALILLRSVPEIVWALLFVRAVGLGDTAGVLAIALTYAGMLGKVYTEILESTDSGATRALLASGASRLQAFMYGSLPAALPELTSYTVYRWECAIRASVVMGFVGAGGLGMQMELSLKMLAGNEVLTMLVVFVALVWISDMISAWLRKWAG
ncbi:MAG: ABC transporter permease subunit [Pseudomonadota bacterium]|nr:ABC transporter permease subunit [Pseudomonadota bacterium]